MGKKRKLPKGYRSTQVTSSITDMKYIDLQRACIIRGIDFEQLVEGDAGRLESWLMKNWQNKKNVKRLDEFDKWRHGIMKSMGKGDEPFIRLGFIGAVDEEGNAVAFKRPRKVKKEKERKERNEDLGNIFKGTKKELTFQCAAQGKTLAETVETVTDKFPEAVEKSIRIWYKSWAKKSKK